MANTTSTDFDQSSFDRLFTSVKYGYDEAGKAQDTITKNAFGRAAEMRQQSDEAYKLAAEPIKRPKPPKLEDMPEPPAEPQGQNPMQALGSVWFFAASIASLATRSPLKTAMKAASGAIKGYNQGQKELSDYQFQRYKLAMTKAQAQNDRELAEYNAAFNDAKISADEKLARLHALTIKHQDTAAAYELEQRGLEGAKQLIEARTNSLSQLLGHQMQWEMTRAWRARGALTGEQLHKNQVIQFAQKQMAEIEADPAKKKHLAWALQQQPFALSAADQQLVKLYQLAKTPLYGAPQEQPQPGSPDSAGDNARADKVKQALANGHPREAVKKAWVDGGGSEEEFETLFPPQGAEAEPPKPSYGDLLLNTLTTGARPF